MIMKKIGKRVLSMTMMTIMTVSLLAGVPSNELSEVQAATTLKAPSKSGSGVVTWDCVYFGRYPQSDATGASKDPIKWRVLSVNGDDALLVADCNLDVQQYHTKWDVITWEACTLRSWLNGYGYEKNSAKKNYSNSNFIDKAFSETEQKAIKTTTLTPNVGNQTQDKVFLLSYADVTNETYGFSSGTAQDKARERKNTAYVAAGGTASAQYTVYTKGTGENNWWWLLDLDASYSNNAYYVGVNGELAYPAGTIGYSGLYDDGNVDTGKFAICPALHLDLSQTGLWSYAGTVSSDGTSTAGEEPPTVTDARPPVEDPETGDSYIPVESEEGEITYTYVPSDDDAEVVEVKGEVTIDGVTRKVTAIADNAFKDNDNLKEIVIGDDITSIGKNAFAGCKNLKKVTIGKNVTSIGSKAFYKCTKLESITIPSKVTSIGTSAFQGCKKLATVKLGKKVTSIGAKAFYKCTKLKTITIPAKVNYIGKQAFGKCKALKTITIKSKKLKNSNVKSKAFKGIYSKATFKVPKSKLKAYKSLLKARGAGSKSQFKKL